MKNLGNISVLATAAAMTLVYLLPVKVAAQNVNRKAIEHTTWHTAPREFQIVDDSPIIRDFREAPQNPGQIAMPPGPSANPGGGHGEGALGPLGGGAPSIPAGGLPLQGGNGPGYRTNPSSIPNLGTLPNARGFGGSNIPARGMGPRGLLPNGSSQNVIGKLMAQKKPVPVANAAAPARALSAPAAKPMAAPAAPAVASYGGNSIPHLGDFGGNGNRTETFVRGSLLRK